MFAIKKIIFLSFFSLCLSAAGNAEVQTPAEIITKSKAALGQLNSVKIKGKTITSTVDITYNESKIDYEKKRFFAVEKKDAKTLRMVYVQDGIAYMYNGLINSWLKFAEEINPVGDVFTKEKILSQFPDDFAEGGFSVELIGEETVDNQLCYVIQNKVVDPQKAAKFAFDFLDRFVSPQIAVLLKENEEMLKDYLETYMGNSESQLWIAKDSFFIIKTLNKYRQPVGPQESVYLEKESLHYDFNQPLEINIPQEAQTALSVSAEELGFKKPYQPTKSGR